MVIRFSMLLGVFASAVLVSACNDNNGPDGDNDSDDVNPPGGGGSGTEPTVVGFRLTTLVTNQTDPDLINPWGLVADKGVFWIADNGTGKVSVYDGAGRTSPQFPTGHFDLGEGLTGVTRIDAAAFPTSFLLPCVSPAQEMLPANLVFASEDGFLIAINQQSAPAGTRVVDSSTLGANYKGVALATMTNGPVLLAADFANARIDMFDAKFNPITPSAFVDPQLPAGWAPFNVAVAVDHVYVMEAKQGQDGDEEAGPGLGAVAIFDMNGTLLARVTSSLFNAPWGFTVADASSTLTDGVATFFIGNFGDGRINRFEVGTFRDLGQVTDTAGVPITQEGLWGLEAGNANGGSPNALYFAAGPEDESAGAYGRIERAL